MGFRSRVGDTLVRVGKTFGTSVPESFTEGEASAQMTPASPFSPGTPIGPYEGYDRQTRQLDFTTGYNISTRPRLHEAVSFPVLTGLVESYDVAQIVIWHRIDSIRSLDFKLVGADHYVGDVTEAIPLGLAALRKPDRKNFFKTWLAKYLYDTLAWDAGTLYRLRNRAGRCIGLQPVDGRLIAPLLDYWGNSPDEPAEAYVQYVNGLPWNWLTRADIIYEPFRPVTGSPYGRPPIESVILNANTDLRFQTFFLQRFTAGNLPAAFASSPESWSPDQIEQFQSYWDAMMYGDQSRKHQIRWMPGGSKLMWSNEKEFSDKFSLYLLQKTCAAFHVVPSDLGLTQDINRSSGESQADVQHRVGDLPLMEHVEGILSAFLQDDLGLPLKLEFDRGEEQVDQLAQAEADQKYMDRGVVGASEIREMRYGLTDAVPIPRVFFTERAGPIPLSSLEAVAGAIDPQTAAPEPGAELPRTAFEEAPGVQPNPAIYGPPLAEEIYGPSAIPADAQTARGGAVTATPVTKEGEGAGITAGTGLFSYDLERDDEGEEPGEAVVKAELAAFRRFERSRVRKGEWRDFEFRAVERVCGHNLNDAGRLSVRKAAGEVAVAGLAVLAADTGRVLMLQRALCDDDPAAGTWEFPGGHCEGTETPLQGAWREWAEETGCVPPPGVQTGSWTSGIYQGIVWTVDAEASVPVRCDTAISNPDDPDGDMAEAIAWWNPADLPGNPALRPELAADIDAVMAALGCTEGAAEACCGGECCQGGCCGGTSGCGCGLPKVPDGSAVAKAAGLPRSEWPGWQYDLTAAEHWAPKVTAAVLAALPASKLRQITRDYLAAHPADDAQDAGKRDLNDQATQWLRAHEPGLTAALAALIAGILADAYAIGAISASAVTAGTSADPGGWEPGDTDAAEARIDDLGLGDDYTATAASQSGDRSEQMAGGFLAAMGRALAGGSQQDSSAGSLAGTLRQAIGDHPLAAGFVLTVLTAVSAMAAGAWYQQAKVEYGTWIGVLDERICQRCLVNAQSEPVPIGQAYPSGDAFPPIHPGDRCAVIPA